MSWVRIDDHAPEHPKQMQAGPEACWLWVRGLAYCSRYLTDGLIPHAVVEGWGGQRAFKLAVRLVNVGLWEYADEGAYRVHDYDDYQPSREQVNGRRHATIERVKRWRYAKGNAHGNGARNAPVTPVTYTAPDPDPDPIRTQDTAALDAPPVVVTVTRTKKAPTNDVGRFLDWWLWGYQQFRGHPYVLVRPKDPATIARLLPVYGLARLKQMAMFLWHDEKDEWIAKTDRGIGILSTKANTLADWIAQDEKKLRQPCADAPEPEATSAA